MPIDDKVNGIICKQKPRLIRPTWDEYYMGMAMFAALRSPDPSTQVGACIINPEHRVISLGYNGLPPGCSNDAFPWEREGALPDTKYAYVIHAERNAIRHSGSCDLSGCTLYVTLFPCNECAKDIISANIEEIVYFSDKYHDSDFTIAARRLFDRARGDQGIKYRQLVTENLKMYAKFIECLFTLPPKP